MGHPLHPRTQAFVHTDMRRVTVSRTLRTAEEAGGELGRYYRRVGVEEGFSARAPGRPLRVLLVIKCLGYGGAERLLVDMVAAGDRPGSTTRSPTCCGTKTPWCRRFGRGERQCTPSAPPTTPICGGWRPFDSCWSSGRYDVVHFHLPYAAALGQLVVASLPRSDRPGVVYTEHSLWDRAKLVESSVAAWLDGQRGAAGDGVAGVLSTPFRHRCGTGPRPWCTASICPGRTPSWPAGPSCGTLVRSELGVTRRRAPVHDRGQPSSREGVRRVARCGPVHRGQRAPHPHRRGGTRPAEHRPARPSRRTRARRSVPVPRPARRRAAIAGGRRRLRPGLSP